MSVNCFGIEMKTIWLSPPHVCVCTDITDVYVSLCAANVEMYVAMFHVWKLVVTFYFSLISNKLLSVLMITPLLQASLASPYLQVLCSSS